MPKDAPWKALQLAYNRFRIALCFCLQNGHNIDTSNFDRAKTTFCFSYFIFSSHHIIHLRKNKISHQMQLEKLFNLLEIDFPLVVLFVFKMINLLKGYLPMKWKSCFPAHELPFFPLFIIKNLSFKDQNVLGDTGWKVLQSNINNLSNISTFVPQNGQNSFRPTFDTSRKIIYWYLTKGFLISSISLSLWKRWLRPGQHEPIDTLSNHIFYWFWDHLLEISTHQLKSK